jgi:hypothetical protein
MVLEMDLAIVPHIDQYEPADAEVADKIARAVVPGEPAMPPSCRKRCRIGDPISEPDCGERHNERERNAPRLQKWAAQKAKS